MNQKNGLTTVAVITTTSWFIVVSFILSSLLQQMIVLPVFASTTTKMNKEDNDNPPNILLFIVDDLGWNQVGYHANKVGNNEIQTPNIDKNVKIELNRGYVTPWCGPSRAAIMTGRTNVYNANVSNVIHSFDDDIGFVSGMPIGTRTIAYAFKQYGKSINKPYKAYYNGKWGIGGTSWMNTPVGMDFDFFRGSWGTGLETCDGLIPSISVIAPYRPFPFDKKFGPLMVNALPGYWEQDPDSTTNATLCTYFQSSDLLNDNEKDIACKTQPRKPPKIIDLDVLDKVREQILTHDYETGPILQVFSTMQLHLPMSYPKEYNDNNTNASNGGILPEYFASDRIKPQASINDNRLATNMAVKYIDDIFGKTIQAIKDIGQWNNTIIYFTSDNGGVIYHGTANNNYPLRASKFSTFEGGVRVPQFISGGWIDKYISNRRKRSISNTYIFPNDIAPTLLQMAGGDMDILFNGKRGANYGHGLFEYIKNSINTSKPVTTHQKVRKVSYTPDWFFDVQVNKTMKFFYTGNDPVLIPRLYEPIWPKNGDLIMDTLYTSVKPCRPGGIEQDCCSLNIEEDWQERVPLVADCDTLHVEAKNLFEIEGGCPKNNDGRNVNPVCIERGEVKNGANPKDLSLWTHYAAAGPFTNSKGQPLNDLPMKCICYGLSGGASPDNVDYFIVRNFGPTQCGKSFLSFKPPQSIYCDGNFAFNFTPKANLIDEYTNVGLDSGSYKRALLFEQYQMTILLLFEPLIALVSYLKREGHYDWPAVNKFPFNGYMDTCKEKGVVPVPFPVISIAPYQLGTRDPTLPFDLLPIGLCSPFSLIHYFCPSHQNAQLKPVVEWVFDRLHPYGVFADGSRWEPMGLIECMIRCPIRAQGTAYIGDGPHGVVV